MSDGFLHKYFLNNSNKRLHKWLHYFDIYERHLARFRGRSPVMIEIGVKGGGSLDMWKAYLGSESRIIGVDINPDCKVHERDGIEIFIGSQDDPSLINSIFSKYPNVDIVLDDGSHIMQHVIASFDLMYDRLNQNGVYIVEDTHTSYWDEFGGGLRRDGTFMELAKDKLDELNAAHSRGALPISEFTRSTDCIACYDSVVVFERRRQGVRQAPITQPM
ncbi:MAG: CmcI family methyltransferase [Bdellovibrionota bacterium]